MLTGFASDQLPLTVSENDHSENVLVEEQNIEDDRVVALIEENKRLKQILKVKDEQIARLDGENLKMKNILIEMEAEMKLLRKEKMDLKETVAKLNVTDSTINNLKRLRLYSSLDSKEKFLWLAKLLREEVSDTPSLSVNSQLLIVLMKLKMNFLISDIAIRFNVSNKTVKRTLDIWIPKLSAKLSSLIRWPNKKALKKYCPEAFKQSQFKNTVCIIDCTEVKIQRPSPQTAQSQTYSFYKSHHTFKFLVGIIPCGHICFLSRA